MHSQSDDSDLDSEELNPWQKASSIFMLICLISPESVAFGAAVGALAGQYLAREMLNLNQPVKFKLS